MVILHLNICVNHSPVVLWYSPLFQYVKNLILIKVVAENQNTVGDELMYINIWTPKCRWLLCWDVLQWPSCFFPCQSLPHQPLPWNASKNKHVWFTSYVYQASYCSLRNSASIKKKVTIKAASKHYWSSGLLYCLGKKVVVSFWWLSHVWEHIIMKDCLALDKYISVFLNGGILVRILRQYENLYVSLPCKTLYASCSFFPLFIYFVCLPNFGIDGFSKLDILPNYTLEAVIALKKDIVAVN